MISIVINDILEYLPAISKYSRYDKADNSDVIILFNKYIDKTISEITRMLLNDSIDISNNLYDNNNNLKQLMLSYLVYNYYLETSYNVEQDKFFILKLEKKYFDNYKIFSNSVTTNDKVKNRIEISFVG